MMTEAQINETQINETPGTPDGTGINLKIMDPDRYYAFRYASETRRDLFSILAAWQATLRLVPNQVSAPPLGEIRLQWWRDAIDEIVTGKPIRAHPFVQEMARAGEHLSPSEWAHIENAIKSLADARARLLYDDPFTDMGNLIDWLKDAEGAFDVCLHGLAGKTSLDSNRLRQAGALYALARFGNALPKPHNIDLNIASDSNNAPTGENLADYMITAWEDARGKLHGPADGLADDELAVCLPFAMTRSYIKGRAGAWSALTRQLTYVGCVLRGKI